MSVYFQGKEIVAGAFRGKELLNVYNNKIPFWEDKLLYTLFDKPLLGLIGDNIIENYFNDVSIRNAGVTYTSDPFGRENKAFHFNGGGTYIGNLNVDSDSIYFQQLILKAYTNSLNNKEDFIISFYYKYGGTGNTNIFTSGNTTTGNPTVLIGQVNNILNFNFVDLGFNSVSVNNQYFNINDYTHILVKFKPNLSVGNRFDIMQIYINGKLVSSTNSISVVINNAFLSCYFNFQPAQRFSICQFLVGTSTINISNTFRIDIPFEEYYNKYKTFYEIVSEPILGLTGEYNTINYFTGNRIPKSVTLNTTTDNFNRPYKAFNFSHSNGTYIGSDDTNNELLNTINDLLNTYPCDFAISFWCSNDFDNNGGNPANRSGSAILSDWVSSPNFTININGTLNNNSNSTETIQFNNIPNYIQSHQTFIANQWNFYTLVIKNILEGENKSFKYSIYINGIFYIESDNLSLEQSIQFNNVFIHRIGLNNSGTYGTFKLSQFTIDKINLETFRKPNIPFEDYYNIHFNDYYSNATIGTTKDYSANFYNSDILIYFPNEYEQSKTENYLFGIQTNNNSYHLGYTVDESFVSLPQIFDIKQNNIIINQIFDNSAIVNRDKTFYGFDENNHIIVPFIDKLGNTVNIDLTLEPNNVGIYSVSQDNNLVKNNIITICSTPFGLAFITIEGGYRRYYTYNVFDKDLKMIYEDTQITQINLGIKCQGRIIIVCNIGNNGIQIFDIITSEHFNLDRTGYNINQFPTLKYTELEVNGNPCVVYGNNKYRLDNFTNGGQFYSLGYLQSLTVKDGVVFKYDPGTYDKLRYVRLSYNKEEDYNQQNILAIQMC